MDKFDGKIFRANDIRGKYPSEINEAAVFEIIFAIKKLFSAEGGSASGGKDSPPSQGSGRASVVVGHDARLSSPSLYKAVLEALKQDEKIKVFEAGLITSPGIYFLVNKLKAGGGIMVTASHNPSEYNGLKIMGKGAMPIGGKEIYKIISND